MGKPGILPPFRLISFLLSAISVLSVPLLAQATPSPPSAVQAVSIPLILPAGLAYDRAGNLVFAESGNHVIRSLSPGGGLTTIAGTSVQGFGGDGGPARAALLDSPAAVAIDAAGNIFVADAHNHRIRRVDASSGVITTFAGNGIAGQSPDGTLASAARLDLPCALAFDSASNLLFADARTHLVRRIDSVSGAVFTLAGDGTQGFRGDLGPAVLAALDAPSGIALDGADNLFIADTHNQRVRRVDHRTGIVTTIAGTGQPGFSGDSAAATNAKLALPRGLTMDASGNLFVVDAGNQRIRRIDASNGQISSIAGEGTETFQGDSGGALTASLDSPRAITVSPAGLATFTDAANGRIRQVDSNALIRTIAGLGAASSANLTLSGASVVAYGAGEVRAALAAGPATGAVTFFDHPAGTTLALSTVPLVGNVSTLATAQLPAGLHRISATYAGDGTHAPAQSNALSLSISPLAVSATIGPESLVYGQALPTLTGSLAGVLPRDAGAVFLVLTSAAGALSPPAVYPVTATLTGPAAGNYVLSPLQASALSGSTGPSIVIAKAVPIVSLSPTLQVHVGSPTQGQPGGVITLIDGANVVASSPLSAHGDAAFSSANLSLGTHSFTAAYAGDQNFQAARSAPALVSIGPVTGEDFSLASTTPATVNAAPGAAAVFAFAVAPISGSLASPVVLSASGLPVGATASFSPALLPPGNTVTAFTLTIRTAKQALFRLPNEVGSLLFATLLPLLLIAKKRRPRALLLAIATFFTLGCGDRITHVPDAVTPVHSYVITVTGTATSSSGATLVHSTNVTLTVQ